jgi:hypothetical protein
MIEIIIKGKIFRVFGFVCLGLLLFVSLALSQNAEIESALKRDFPELTKRMAIGQPADFVIVIDKSGSMRSFWNPVKQAVSSFLAAIPDGDYVSVIAFGTDSGYLTTPSPVNSSTRAYLIHEVEMIKEPKDADTDLGRAFERTLGELNRPEGNRLKFVFFLTDFKHEPPNGSPFRGTRNPEDAVWQRLIERRRNEQHGNVLQVFALLLPLEAEVGRDIALGKSLFPELEQVNVNQYTLLPWFERRKAEIARDKLRAFVHNDSQKSPFEIEKIYIQRGILRGSGKLYASVKPAKGRIVETVALPSLNPKISIKGDGVTEVEFKPQTVQNIPLSPSTESLKIPLATVRYLCKLITLSTKVRDASVEIEGIQSLAPSFEIQKLNLPTDVSFSAASTLPLEISYGYIPLSILIVIACLIAVAIIGTAYYCRPEYVSGEINVLGAVTRGVQKSERRKNIVIGNVQAAEGIPVPNADWRLVMQAFCPSWMQMKKPRGIYVRMERGQATLIYRDKRQSITTLDWVRIYRGCTIEVGGKRISFN